MIAPSAPTTPVSKKVPYASAHAESLLLLSLPNSLSKRMFSRHTGSITTIKHRLRIMHMHTGIDGFLASRATQRMPRTASSAMS